MVLHIQLAAFNVYKPFQLCMQFLLHSSFTENHGRDIVYISHNHCNFSESNFFRKNTGSSIRVRKSGITCKMGWHHIVRPL